MFTVADSDDPMPAKISSQDMVHGPTLGSRAGLSIKIKTRLQVLCAGQENVTQKIRFFRKKRKHTSLV